MVFKKKTKLCGYLFVIEQNSKVTNNWGPYADNTGGNFFAQFFH
jgi:hypothetical protein